MTHLHAKPHEVRAMLAGDEFVILRPLKPQPESRFRRSNVGGKGVLFFTAGQRGAQTLDLPYAIGDAVVVKEAHYLTDDGDEEFAVFAEDAEAVREHLNCISRLEERWPFISAETIRQHRRLRPSAQMPRWASRLTLTVTDVQVKRLQSITEEEARLAGSQAPLDTLPKRAQQAAWSERQAFASIWNANHPKTPWDSNPWIVVARCQVHRCNISALITRKRG